MEWLIQHAVPQSLSGTCYRCGHIYRPSAPACRRCSPCSPAAAPAPPEKLWACSRRADAPLCLSGAAQPHIAHFILSTRPAAVVVESAVNCGHGAATGSVLRCDDPAARQANADLRRLCQLAAQVAHARSSDRALAVRPGSSESPPCQSGVSGSRLCSCLPTVTWVMLLLRGRPCFCSRAMRSSKYGR